MPTWPELNPDSVAWSSWEYSATPPLNGMLVHHRVTPSAAYCQYLSLHLVGERQCGVTKFLVQGNNIMVGTRPWTSDLQIWSQMWELVATPPHPLKTANLLINKLTPRSPYPIWLTIWRLRLLVLTHVFYSRLPKLLCPKHMMPKLISGVWGQLCISV